MFKRNINHSYTFYRKIRNLTSDTQTFVTRKSVTRKSVTKAPAKIYKPLGSTGGGGGRGLPAMGLRLRLVVLGFRGKVPVLEGAGLGSALGRPPRFLELLGGATGPDPGISTLG